MGEGVLSKRGWGEQNNADRQPQVSPECSQLQLQNGPEPLDFITPLLDNAD